MYASLALRCKIWNSDCLCAECGQSSWGNVLDADMVVELGAGVEEFADSSCDIALWTDIRFFSCPGSLGVQGL